MLDRRQSGMHVRRGFLGAVQPHLGVFLLIPQPIQHVIKWRQATLKRLLSDYSALLGSGINGSLSPTRSNPFPTSRHV